MKSDSSCPPRILVCSIAAVWLVAVGNGCGQEVNPVVDGRVGPDPFLGIKESAEDGRRGGLELGAVVAAAYNTNIFLSNTDAVSDMVYRVAPLIAYTQGDAEMGEGGYVRVAYQPDLVLYGESTGNNRVDQSAGLEAGWKGKISRIIYQGEFRKLGDATADTGTETERQESKNEVRVAWLGREKIWLEVAAGGWQTRYDNSSLVDSAEYYGEVALRYAYSPKTEAGFFYQAGRLKISGADSQTVQQIVGTLRWQPREKISFKIDGGAEFRRADGISATNPVINARVDWIPREGTRLFLTAFQRQEVSALNEGQIYEVKGVTAGISQRLDGNWTMRLEGGYEVASYIPNSATGAGSREDKIWFIRPALNYQFSDQFDGSIFVEASDNDSTDADFGYDAALTGLELNYKF